MKKIEVIKTSDMKNYRTFQYLYPPRPEAVITSDRLTSYQGKGWQAQYKKNGTNSIVAVSPDWEFTVMNRHNEPHKAWAITDHIKEVLRESLPPKTWTVLVGELLHSKGPTIRDTMFFHDVLVFNSTYLLGSTFEQRQKWLSQLLPSNVESYSHYMLTDKVWRAKTFTDQFAERFESIKDSKIDEGLVLKKPDGVLRYCDQEKTNMAWQIKCRYPTKIYNY